MKIQIYKALMDELEVDDTQIIMLFIKNFLCKYVGSEK